MKTFDRLFVMWIDPQGERRRHVVGQVWREPGGFAFGYDLDRLGDARTKGFVLFPEFPDGRGLEDPYRSRYLFASFAQRIPKPARPDFGRMMSEWGVLDPDDPMEILARSGGVQMTDQIELSEYRALEDSLDVPLQFRLAATRHFEDSRDLAVGEHLDLVCEPDNPVDGCAVLVTRDGRKVGHVPRQYSALVHDRLTAGVPLGARVVRQMVLPDDRGKWVVEIARPGVHAA